MTILPVLEYPNPVLREICVPIEPDQIQSEPTQALIQDMIETLYDCQGAVGLAAPQVGHPVQLLIMDATAKTTRSELKVMINPVIESQSKWKYAREGCLSFPDYLVTVKRARKVVASWLDQHGQAHQETFQEFEAIILQHELDHLAGILFIDRIQNPQRDLIRRSEQALKEDVGAS